MRFSGAVLWHAVAFLVICIWGYTLVSTRVLLNYGMSEFEIYLFRSCVAWVLLVVCAPKRFLSDTVKDELLFLVAGFTGGTVYFVAENAALKYTFVSNVALITCLAPLMTAVLCMVFRKERPGWLFFAASAVALTGVAMIAFNSVSVFSLSPAGDLLTALAAFSWAVYCLTVEKLQQRYDTRFVTRKVFFYGMLTTLPLCFVFSVTPDVSPLFTAEPLANFVFLSVIASFVCFLLWNKAISEIGPVPVTAYIYCLPLVSMLSANLVLGEPLNLVMWAGAALIISGVYFANRAQRASKLREEA